VPRICGVCSTAHHVAAVKALEDVFEVVPPPLALKIRELLMLGQLIQNQATSLFIFTMPDRLGVESIFQAGTAESADAQADRATRALMVRQAGTHLISLAGGQFIHPVKAVIGGVTGGIPRAAADAMRVELESLLPVACDLFDDYWALSLALRERIGTWGDDAPAYYIAGIDACAPNYYGDQLRVLSLEGEMCCVFSPREFHDNLTYRAPDYSYAGQTSYQGHVLRANSLARINMAGCSDIACPGQSYSGPEGMGAVCMGLRADAYLAQFRATFGQPAHALLLYDLARGIELVYALERAITLLSDPLDEGETAVPYIPRDGEGYGLVEAPRGPLIHHYHIENGLVARAEFIIPTVHNMLAIERALRVVAERYITPERVDLELERAVGRVVRAFDPCIACATH
ncbi:MAG: nickel-dependent hydrogenase large subunit, partial [Anaerolineae bacterium]|nr:nickel-dependent hydrogenase large subunit [Anaerolineae bacterium]